jgi:hypothetical protein
MGPPADRAPRSSSTSTRGRTRAGSRGRGGSGVGSSRSASRSASPSSSPSGSTAGPRGVTTSNNYAIFYSHSDSEDETPRRGGTTDNSSSKDRSGQVAIAADHQDGTGAALAAVTRRDETIDLSGDNHPSPSIGNGPTLPPNTLRAGQLSPQAHCASCFLTSSAQLSQLTTARRRICCGSVMDVCNSCIDGRLWPNCTFCGEADSRPGLTRGGWLEGQEPVPPEPTLTVGESYIWGMIRCRPCGRTHQDHASEAFVLSCCLEGWDSTTTLPDCLLTECHPIGARTFCTQCITKNSQCGFCHISDNPPMPIPLSTLFGKQNTRNSEDERKHTPDSDENADSDHSQEETIDAGVEEVAATVSDNTVVPTKKTGQPC